jgi:hypothetical protein
MVPFVMSDIDFTYPPCRSASGGRARQLALVQTFGINETNAREHCAAQAARTAFQTAGALLSLIRSLQV